MILAGDVGGTKVNLALYDFVDGTLRNTRESLYPAREYSGLEAIVREFLGADVPTAACFGVRTEPSGRWRVYAPHGLSDVFNLVVRPNPVLAPPGVYQAKAERWRRQWPALTVLPWPATA